MPLGHRAVQAAIISGIFATLGTLFCALRLWTRVVIIRAVGYEDFVLLFSWVQPVQRALLTSD